MTTFLDELEGMSTVSRRSFVKASAAAAAAVAVSGIANTTAHAVEADADVAPVEEGQWVTAACWHNCGGRCLNKVYVKDGIAIRQKTDDTHDDSPDWPQQRGCLRGRSQRHQIFAADRIKYPMKRKGWTPDNPNGEMRGQDEWERISWEEAIDYVAEGLTRAKENYGNRSILLIGGARSSNATLQRPLALWGGYCEYWNTNSFGSWIKSPFYLGWENGGKWDQTVNDRYDLRNCETIVMLSMNPAWSAPGSQTWNYWQAKKAGAKFICIDPFYNDTYALLDAKWLPVRPTTDVAFLLGLAYAMIEQDDEKHLIDWDFLNRCTVGFDKDHMPAGAKKDINFQDYVLGKYDDEPKTPEWASKICGVDAQEIRDLAVAMGKDNKVAFLCGMASGREHNTDNLPQLIMTIGAMGGHVGKSGHMTGSTMHATSGNGGPALIKAGSNGQELIPNPVDDSINANGVWDAILEGKYWWTGAGNMGSETQFGPGSERDIDIHVIYHGNSAVLQTSDAMKKGIEAHRKVDMVVSHAQFLTTNARYSDIILPITTEWERGAGFLGGSLVHSSNREMMIAYSNVIPPMFDAKSDKEISILIGEKLGLTEEEMYPIPGKELYYNTISSMQVVEDDGVTYTNAVELTKEDIEELGAGKPQKGKMPYKELIEKGVYQVKRHPGDNFGYIALKDFREDPEKNPVTSESGKLEIYCQKLADVVNGMGFSSIEPIPTYIPVRTGYVETFSDWEKQEKGEFPLQVINPHYLRRSHTVFDNIPQLREAWTNPVFISGEDANAIGVADGETVLVSSPYGQTIRRASVTERIRPGVVALPHGAWVDVDEATGIDRAGADNYLTGQVGTGQGVSGFNSMICKLERYMGEQLGEDVDLPLRIALKDGE